MDPVPIIQQDLDQTLLNMKRLLLDREDMLNDPRGGNIEIFNSLGVQISNDAASARSILQDIQESIAAVRGGRCDLNISEPVLQQREMYVSSTLNQISKIETEVTVQNSKASQIRKSNVFSTSNFSNNNESFGQIGDENQLVSISKQERLLQLEKDAQMGVQISTQIVNELQSQKTLIEDLDQGVTNATEAMEKVTNRIKDLIESEGKTPTLLVAGLSVAFIILLFFVI